MFWIGMFIGANLGAIAIAIFTAKSRVTDDECALCSKSYNEYIGDLERKLHGMRCSNGKLGKEIQNMAFMKDGYNVR